MGIVKNRSSSRGELIVAILAVVELLFGFQFNGWLFAAQAEHTFGPAKAAEKFSAFIFSRESVYYVS
jgi:hypothetical protein